MTRIIIIGFVLCLACCEQRHSKNVESSLHAQLTVEDINEVFRDLLPTHLADITKGRNEHLLRLSWEEYAALKTYYYQDITKRVENIVGKRNIQSSFNSDGIQGAHQSIFFIGDLESEKNHNDYQDYDYCIMIIWSDTSTKGDNTRIVIEEI